MYDFSFHNPTTILFGKNQIPVPPDIHILFFAECFSLVC